MWDGPPEPPVRREVIELLRKLDPRGAHPGAVAQLSPEDWRLLAGATNEEKRAGVRQVTDMAKAKAGTLVRMKDDTMTALPTTQTVRDPACHAKSSTPGPCRPAAHARRTGRPRGAHDLLIAATAAATRRTVVSADAAAVAELPGVAHLP